MAARAEQQFIAKHQHWTLNPIDFVKDVFGMDGSAPGKIISEQQRDGLECYRRILVAKLKKSRGIAMTAQEKEDGARLGITVMSGHGTGKTAFASWCLCHFMTCRPFCKIPCVAPVGKQLETNLWPEVKLWLRKSTMLGELIAHQAEKIFMKDHHGKEWFAIPRTVNVGASPEEQAETLAGMHADNMLVVVDEASGVPDPVFRPLEGGLTGPVNFCILIGNPTQSTGYFIDSHTKYRKDWLCLQWNAEDSELVDRSHIERMARKFGKDSNAYRIRVQGLPPKSSPDTLIPWEWVMAAANRELPIDPTLPVCLGIDVGRSIGGDDSVMAECRGLIVPRFDTWNGLNTQDLAYTALKEIQQREAACTALDVIGWGAGTYDTLVKIAPGVILPVNVAESANEADKFYRLRDELWWHIREEFQNGTLVIPNDDDVIAQFSNVKYNFGKTAGDKIKVESKQELRDRGCESPNKADAVILARYAAKFAGATVRHERTKWRRPTSAYVG